MKHSVPLVDGLTLKKVKVPEHTLRGEKRYSTVNTSLHYIKVKMWLDFSSPFFCLTTSPCLYRHAQETISNFINSCGVTCIRNRLFGVFTTEGFESVTFFKSMNLKLLGSYVE